MNRVVYVNGEYCAPDAARVSIFDRGLLFADGVYEVVGVIDGKLLDFDRHMNRLDRSLGELDIPKPMTTGELLAVHRELVARNAVRQGLVYMQITRGAAEREFIYPDDVTPTVFMFTQPKSEKEEHHHRHGVALSSQPDIRWARRDIKTVGLLAQVLAKRAAKRAGAYEALLVMDGYVTEGGATSVYIVKNDLVITRPLSNDILPGCTRACLLELSAQNRIAIEERPFTVQEVYAADEVFITGASTYVCPVVKVDDHVISDGAPGPVVRRLQEMYLRHARDTAI